MKNKVNKKYFLLSLKREIPFMIFNLVVFSLSYLLPLGFNGGFSIIEETSAYRYRYNLSTYYGFLLFVFAVYAVIIPIKTFIFLTKKKYIDSYYSLPIERKSVTLINIIVNIICVLAPFTVVFFTGSLMTLLFFNEILYGYYIVLYFILVISFILYFMYNSFFFTRANKLIDGVVTMIFANFLFLLIVASIVFIFDIKSTTDIKLLAIDVSELHYVSLPFMPFIRYGNYFNELIVARYDYYDYVRIREQNPNFYSEILNYDNWFNEYHDEFNPIYLIFLAIIGVAAIILLFVLFNKRKPEQAEEIPTSNFGLKVLNPLCFSLLTIMISVESSIIETWLLFGIIVIGYLGTTLLELRTFKFPLYKILMLAGMFTLTIIF